MRWLPVSAVLAVASALIVGGCREETKVDVASSLHPDRMPTMTTHNVSTMISDSGVTQYKIVAPLWEVYDEGADPHWRFPEGLYLRKYDRKFNVIATIAADSAIYFKKLNLWRLDGHVEVTKVPGELFLSQQVFWDQNKAIVYSDSFIHIENATHMMEGYGFHARQDFTEYSIKRPMGIFPAQRDNLRSGTGASTASPASPAAGRSHDPVAPAQGMTQVPAASRLQPAASPAASAGGEARSSASAPGM
ncbi:MAG: LPS export ABC transporter periplasmic protein LptC [Muribaculaceae bacterium]|nr:LPS export ABC transporter periplasmic protein LptC [Muribaculaceae bacterium]